MKRILLFLVIGFFLCVSFTTPILAMPVTITDEYYGSDAHMRADWYDVIGSVSDFGIKEATIDLKGTKLTVDIQTNFIGKSGSLFRGRYTDTNLFNGEGIGYGDLFLASTWKPNKTNSANYLYDSYLTGTTWTYGVALDNRWSNPTTGGTAKLYGLDNNTTDTLRSDSFINSTYATFRNGQEVAVNTANADFIKNASWSIDTIAQIIHFEIDLAGTDLLKGEGIAFHWGETCGNDVIEGYVANPVPEPATMLLLGSGLIGLAGFGRKKLLK